MQADTQILLLCCRRALATTNGHGRRWAREACVRQLAAQGASPAIALASARAMVSVARAIQAAEARPC